jgi:hypothetical protein
MLYLCPKMKSNSYIQRTVFAALLVLGMQVVYAAFSFTGIADEKTRSNKYSLKNLSALSHKTLSFTSLKTGLQYKGVQQPMVARETANGIEMTSMLRYDNGSTTYIYPYKFKVKASKFKTPAPQR